MSPTHSSGTPVETSDADLLREAVDGRTGEDPPADWRVGQQRSQ